MELNEGEWIDGRYLVEARIGAGGQATVYRVRHAELGSQHAMKVIHASSASHRERILLEGRSQAALDHPNVVRVTDVVSVHGAPALIMDLVRGQDLHDYLRRTTPALDEIDRIAVAVIAGVREAHAHGVVHRDLKPENILLAETADGIVPKVTDFGLALRLDATDRRTPSHASMGTPAYMSPEQVRSAARVDERTDVWSLGVLLYEMLAGAQPFLGSDLMDLYGKIVAARYPPLRERRPDAPARMVRAIEGALVADPGKRLQSCDALLDQWTRDRAEPPPARRPARGLLAATGAVALLLLPAGLGWVASSRSIAAAEPPPALPAQAAPEVSPLPPPPEREPPPVDDRVRAPLPGPGRFRVDGASGVLRRGDRELRPGDPVPPGEYTLVLDFADGTPPFALDRPVVVVAGQQTVIRCTGLHLCAPVKDSE